MSNTRTRGFCFTINNYTDEDIDTFKELEHRNRPKIKFGIIGKEVGDSGTPHLQGYVYFENANKSNFNNLNKWFPRAHIEPAKGTPKQNFEYCSKDGDFISFGKVPAGTGKRSDLKTVRDKIKDKKIKNLKDFIEDEDTTLNLQNIRVTEKLLEVYPTTRMLDNMPTVIWKFGKSGTGKSRDAYEYVKGKDYYVCCSNGKWWNGYDGQEYVIIDDWRPDFCKYNDLLRILDRYPCKVETKGGMRELLASTFIITSPFNPAELYVGSRDDPYQLCRRIKSLEWYDGIDCLYLDPIEVYNKEMNKLTQNSIDTLEY